MFNVQSMFKQSFYCSDIFCSVKVVRILLLFCSMEFLSRSSGGDGPLVAFGSTDGVIRVLSMITWKVCLFQSYNICFVSLRGLG